MKLGQLIEYSNRIIFLQKLCRKWGRRDKFQTSLYFLKKPNMSLKQAVCSLVSISFDSPQLAYNKNKLYKTFNYWFRDMLNFNFSEKGLGLFSRSHFVHDFSRKMFPILHSINWPTSFVWLHLLPEILDNMYITIVC